MNDEDIPPVASTDTKRYILQAEEELRLEVPFRQTASSSDEALKFTLQKGSCELQGVELALQKTYTLEKTGGYKLAFLTWYGCVIDIQGNTEIDYISDECDCNIAYVNTHAQLEVLRDEAYSKVSQKETAAGPSTSTPDDNSEGPRVMVVGPKESGKSSLCRTLAAYAAKVGRAPLLVDLDPHDNMISIPGTLSVCNIHKEMLSVEAFASSTNISSHTSSSSSSSLILWHGNSQISDKVWKEQVTALAMKINQRMKHETTSLLLSSGIIVNTGDNIQTGEGYERIVHAVHALSINVVLVMGHDRLYSMLNKDMTNVKIIKLPRSGGVVSRDESSFLRPLMTRSIRQYFNGIPPNHTFTPFLLQISLDKIKIYQYSELNLSASLLPVAASQTTETLQLVSITDADQLQKHTILAVCHPRAVEKYNDSGKASDLAYSGVAGFCAVEKVNPDSNMIHLLCPCAGSLPSDVLLMGNITWMD